MIISFNFSILNQSWEEQCKASECDFTEEKQRNVWKMEEQRGHCLVIRKSTVYCLDQETICKNEPNK